MRSKLKTDYFFRSVRSGLMMAAVFLLVSSVGACAGKGSTEQQSGIPVQQEISSMLEYEDRMELDYAKEFAIDEYKDGYRLISISDGSRFLVVPEGKEAPDDLEADIMVLNQPVDHIYLAATAVMDMITSIDALDAIRLSGTKSSGWYIEEAKEAMEEGSILYAGKYSAPDYERIVSEGCRLAIENTMINHAPEVREKLEKFGIPVFLDYSSYETHPLGRVEWVKLYGVLLGKEEQAERVFDGEETAFEDAICGEPTGK